ncbi:hypothetical protein DBR06_SOUSAS21310017 [Sousa chinensis]|uniref:Uncharacterized protein n=1 Tax=Sousa chinensis TaxID=103600 RepID=A0A484GIB9_SOUCH|nr:hypothetical protein DBR06_SOUSAS21310017 [Sousa chinensis]
MEEMRRSGGRRGEKRREKWWAQNCRSCSHRRLAWPEAEYPKASRARAGWASSGARISRAEPRGRGRPRLLPCLASLDVQNDKGEPGALLESKSLEILQYLKVPFALSRKDLMPFSNWNHGGCRIEGKAFRNKWRDFTEPEIECLRKKFAQKMLQNARKKLIYEKANHYRTEIQKERMTRKAGKFGVPAGPKWAFLIRITGISGRSERCYSFFVFAASSTALLLSSARLQLRFEECGTTYFMGSENECIYNYCYGKINKKRIALTDNTLLHPLVNMASSTWRI